MNNISLTQLSLLVAAVSLASFFVNANQTSNYTTNESGVLNTVKTTHLEAGEASNERFTFTSLDSDQNGKLSKQEVIKSRNNWLAKAFGEIDANADKSLTEQELVDFAAQIVTTSKSTS